MYIVSCVSNTILVLHIVCVCVYVTSCLAPSRTTGPWWGSKFSDHYTTATTCIQHFYHIALKLAFRAFTVVSLKRHHLMVEMPALAIKWGWWQLGMLHALTIFHLTALSGQTLQEEKWLAQLDQDAIQARDGSATLFSAVMWAKASRRDPGPAVDWLIMVSAPWKWHLGTSGSVAFEEVREYESIHIYSK